MNIMQDQNNGQALSSITINDIVQSATNLLSKNSEFDKSNDLFTIKTANEWIEQAKTRPIPKMLFGELWFEGELSILFADTNLGKSILAVQIGDSISRGVPISMFKLEADRQRCLYCDFELSSKQFENRYSNNYENHYHFDENFIRLEINPDASLPESGTFEDHLINSMEDILIKTNIKILIVDNITFLRSENEKAKDALPLMKRLKSLKTKYNLSILVLAHTPKRDLSKPINRNDLQGSKMLINFCDSAFSIGESHKDKSIRYLKQIKSRNTEIIYDTENVCICYIEKPDNFLLFDHVCFGKEREHLKQQTDKERETRKGQVLELNKQNLSLREIGKEIGISHTQVSRILKECGNM